MTREERLKWLAERLYEEQQSEKEHKTNREGFKKEFMRLIEDGFDGRDHILPVKTIEVPADFWKKTGMTKAEFIESRFPGWDVEHVEKDISTSNTVFVLKRNPHYLSGTIEVETDDGILKVSKEVAEYTPEMDWNTLREERPDLYKRLANPVITLELDEEMLEYIASEEPEELAVLQRHMKVKEPSLKVQPRMTKRGKEDK